MIKMPDQPIAYAMYDMGEGIFWNEIAFRDNILNSGTKQYQVYAMRINELRYDSHKGELALGLERSCSGSNCAFTFFYESAINSFMHINDVQSIDRLRGKYLIGLFSGNNDLKWIIAYPTHITQDDLNQTRIEAGDFEHLPKYIIKRLNDRLGE